MNHKYYVLRIVNTDMLEILETCEDYATAVAAQKQHEEHGIAARVMQLIS